MENLRWVLIFAGVAILVALWFSGRAARRDPGVARRPDPLLGDETAGDFTARLDETPFKEDVRFRGVRFKDEYDAFGDIDPALVERPVPASPDGGQPPLVERAPARPSPEPPTVSPDVPDEVWTSDPLVPRADRPARRGVPDDDGSALSLDPPPTALDTLAQKFEAIGERLAPKRRQRVAASAGSESEDEGDEREEQSYATKIVTLHVVAPEGTLLPPERLLEVFEQRGYHHGDMSIYHSMYQERIVFSVARMIKPGTFDPTDLATFETPGLALILQLPGPVAADTAFEVMLTEAFEIAAELGATVLDGNRSTLGRQTEQHLREGIHEYMHRQKYFDSVA